MKSCRDCKEIKGLEEFNKKKDGYLGRQTRCRMCVKIYAKKHREENLDKYKKWGKESYQRNKEEVKRKQREYTAKNKEVVYAKNKIRYYKNQCDILKQKKEYYRNNEGVIKARVAVRRGYKIKATPQWLSEEHLQIMEDIFTLCKIITEDTGIMHHVDHIIPLKGKTVSGLNVPWNMQILTAKENLSKGNRLTDDALL